MRRQQEEWERPPVWRRPEDPRPAALTEGRAHPRTSRRPDGGPCAPRTSRRPVGGPCAPRTSCRPVGGPCAPGNMSCGRRGGHACVAGIRTKPCGQAVKPRSSGCSLPAAASTQASENREGSGKTESCVSWGKPKPEPKPVFTLLFYPHDSASFLPH